MTVARFGAREGSISVEWSITPLGDATRLDVDGPLSGTVVFRDGADRATIEIDLAADGLTDGDAELQFQLEAIEITGASGSFGTRSFTATVVDLDLATDGDDRLRGSSGDNRINGLGGDDVILGGDGDDRLVGGADDDRLLGQGDRDRLSGKGGDDRMAGGDHRDRLFGGGGDDRLYGGDDADLLVGGGGTDRLTGGADDDVFLFASAAHIGLGSERDRIFDFEDGDIIDLARIDANANRDGHQTFRFVGDELTGRAGQLAYADGVVSGDTDGDGDADFEIGLVTEPDIDASDFQLLLT